MENMICTDVSYSRRVHNGEPMDLYLLPMADHALLLCNRSQSYIHRKPALYLRAILICLLNAMPIHSYYY